MEKYPDRSCERFLSEREFRRLGRVLGELEAEGKVSASAVAAFRLLMLTGCRRNEILTLRWEEVDLDAGGVEASGRQDRTHGPWRCRRRQERCSPPCPGCRTTRG